MHSKQNRLFKSRRFQYDYKNKWIKKLTNHISCKCECEFHEKKCNSNQNILINDGKMFITINAGASVNIKKHYVCKKYI